MLSAIHLLIAEKVCKKLLQKNGYKVYNYSFDFLTIKKLRELKKKDKKYLFYYYWLIIAFILVILSFVYFIVKRGFLDFM